MLINQLMKLRESTPDMVLVAHQCGLVRKFNETNECQTVFDSLSLLLVLEITSLLRFGRIVCLFVCLRVFFCFFCIAAKISVRSLKE